MLRLVASPGHAATFTVTNTSDSGNGSLRKAISDANAAAGPHTIIFKIPASDPNFVDVDSAMVGGDANPDVFVIRPVTSLPGLNVTKGITIDGHSQKAFGGDTNPFGPEISLFGNNAVITGLNLFGPSNKILGLNINSFLGDGVTIFNNGNTLQGNFIGNDPTGTLARPNSEDGIDCRFVANNVFGGTKPGEGNVIAGNTLDGLRLRGATASNNIVKGNIFGTDPTGSFAVSSGGDGVESGGSNNVIGGDEPGAGNLMSGHTFAGVRLFWPTSTGTVVMGNRIGTNLDGTQAIPNSIGVDLTADAAGVTIGGTIPGAGNLISGNTQAGIRITKDGGTGAVGNIVQGNKIGTDVTGSNPLPNGHGIWLNGASSTTVGGTESGAGNLIAFNQNHGLLIADNASTDNLVSGNSITDNGQLGIDIFNDGVSANDGCDAVRPQNFPVLTSAETADGGVRILGSLNSVASQLFTIEFFANDACDSSGNGEGKYYLGQTTVTTDGTCSAPIDVTLYGTFFNPVYITATATDTQNNTSEFSSCVMFEPGPIQCQVEPMTIERLTNTTHTVTATVTSNSVPLAGITVNFEVVSGPRTGQLGSAVTDAEGQAAFQYAGNAATGIDTILATGTVAAEDFAGIATCEWVDSLSTTADLFPILTVPDFTCTTSGITNICSTAGTLVLKNNTKTYVSGNFSAKITRYNSVIMVNAKVKNLVVNLRRVPLHAVAVYLSSDDTLDPFDLFIKSVTTTEIKALADQNKPIKFNGTLPAWIPITGKYLVLKVDSQLIVNETDEDNNIVVLGPIP
jgi:hypothetical protein